MEFSYKKNMSEVVQRHEKLWTQNFTDGVLVKVDVGGINTVDFHIAGVMHHAPDYEKMFGAYRDFYAQRADILDDSIPVARASLGSAAIGHFFGGEVRWTPGGAFSPNFIDDLKTFDFSQLNYNPENRWQKNPNGNGRLFCPKRQRVVPSMHHGGLDWAAICRVSARSRTVFDAL